MEKTVSEAIKYRRSVRRFDKDLEIDDNIVKKCIENAVLAQQVVISNYGNFII
jgi:nitroreductase